MWSQDTTPELHSLLLQYLNNFSYYYNYIFYFYGANLSDIGEVQGNN